MDLKILLLMVLMTAIVVSSHLAGRGQADDENAVRARWRKSSGTPS
jgi:hypothetical protein